MENLSDMTRIIVGYLGTGCNAIQIHFSKPGVLLGNTRANINTSFSSQTVGRDSSVGIATHYGQDGPGIQSRCWARFSAPIQTCPGAHPACYTRGSGCFPTVKRPGLVVEHPLHLASRLRKE